MPFNRIPLIFIFLLFSAIGFSQSSINGVVLDKKNNKPLSNVSISVNTKKIGSLSDPKGHFALSSANLKKTDTLILSSVGYSTLKIPIADAMQLKDFFLSEESKNLEDVVLKAYKNHSVEGSFSEVTGFFRSWTTRGGGGEIGRVIQVRSSDFKVEKVRFKSNNQCDTCFIRLHIRSVVNGYPSTDLLQDSITVEIHKSAFDDKSAEFDLTEKNIIIKNNTSVFIGLETIRCNSVNNTSCNLAYIGTEEGNYLYKADAYKEWEESGMHSLYLKMFYTY